MPPKVFRKRGRWAPARAAGRSSAKAKLKALPPEKQAGYIARTGRPPLFENPEDFSVQVNLYAEWCRQNDRKLTMAGMALYLGFCSRQSLHDLEKRPRFSYVVKKARLLVQQQYEERLLAGGQAAGAIFWLKNHAGYSDRTEVEHSGGLQIDVKQAHRELEEKLSGVRNRISPFLQHLAEKNDDGPRGNGGSGSN